MITFLNPASLLLLLLMPFAGLFLRWRKDSYTRRLQMMNMELQSQWSWGGVAIWMGICVLVIVALARPVWGTELQPIETQGVSIMFVLDVSKSMDAEDMPPSRLERAKLSLEDLFKRLSGNELGLVLFAGQAVVQFPLTTDTLSASAFVRQVTTNSISAQGTNIAGAIQLAVQNLAAASKGKHLLILLTDGEGHDGDVNSAVSTALQQGITIYTIGYGDTAGTLIPLRNSDGSISDKRDSSGNPVLSALDEKTLTTIAGSTGGSYQHAAPNGIEVENLIQTISQYTPNTLNRGVEVTGVEHFDIFIALAVILLTVDLIFLRSQK